MIRNFLLAFLAIFLFIGILGFISPQNVEASKKVRGYFKRNGTYVYPYYRSNPDRFKWNNYSSRGNYNPFTGKRGYKYWYP